MPKKEVLAPTAALPVDQAAQIMMEAQNLVRVDTLVAAQEVEATQEETKELAPTLVETVDLEAIHLEGAEDQGATVAVDLEKISHQATVHLEATEATNQPRAIQSMESQAQGAMGLEAQMVDMVRDPPASHTTLLEAMGLQLPSYLEDTDPPLEGSMELLVATAMAQTAMVDLELTVKEEVDSTVAL